jgi:hypothetical protein
MVKALANRQSKILRMTYKAFINLDCYPIDRPGPELESCLDDVRSALAEGGCAVLKKFLTQAAVDALKIEADTVANYGHRSFNRTNVYFTKGDPSLPEADPRRRFFDHSNAFIPADNFQTDGRLHTIHDAPGFDQFILSGPG